MSTDLILFDIDGTLLDSGNIIIGAQERTASELGLVHPGREAGFGVVGMSLDLALAKLFGNAVPVDHLSDTYKRIFNGMRGTAGFEEPLFGGVPEVLAEFAPERRLRLPMQPEQRSLNLSNAAAVTVFEAWRQAGFPGAL